MSLLKSALGGVFAFGFLLAMTSSVVLASADRAQVALICEQAARVASHETGVPLDVLRAISLTETGRESDGAFMPWPWTVNMEGVGKWFDSENEARQFVDRHFNRGARSFDVGCFQINYRWHGKAFNSIEAMFDPLTNARYAARFLGELYSELGDWSKAAGAYHSRTPKFAKKYSARFNRIRANLGELPAPESTQPMQLARIAGGIPRKNRFPLLQGGSSTTVASLVPLGNRTDTQALLESTRASPWFGTK